MQQGNSAGAPGATATLTLTDEQILGLEPMPDAAADAAAPGSVPAAGTSRTLAGNSAVARVFPDASAAGEPEDFPIDGAEPRQPPQGPGREAAAEARAWRSAATDIAGLDAAYFSDTPGARAGLAARLYDSDPAALRAMLADSARVIAQRDPQALAALAQELGVRQEPGARSVAQGAPTAVAGGPEAFTPDSPRSLAAPRTEMPQGSDQTAIGRPELQNRAAFPADAYRAFESATNDAVARRVQQSIERTLGQTLPDGTPEGARRRIAEDIFEEVHASLAADRAQVTDLLSVRARAVMPEVARRVVAEWTSSVLASDRAKSARVAAAAARRDVTGGRLPEPIPASALRPRDLDYRRLSDEQILDL